MYPRGPVIGNAGLNITVMSLNGELGIGIKGCPDLLLDLWGAVLSRTGPPRR